MPGQAESAQAVERTHARDLGIHAAAQSFRAVLPRSGPRARNDAARMGAHHQHRSPSKQPGLQRPAVHGASKGGIAQLTRAWPKHGRGPERASTANAIAPGFFKTQLTAPLFDKPEVVEALARQTTMNRWASWKISKADHVPRFPRPVITGRSSTSMEAGPPYRESSAERGGVVLPTPDQRPISKLPATLTPFRPHSL